MTQIRTPTPTVKLNGRPLRGDVADGLGRVVVELHRNLPAMCEVELLDFDGTLLDEPFRVGTPITVDVDAMTDAPGHASKGKVFEGAIVAVEAMFEGVGRCRYLLRAYDRAHRLHGERRTETYLKQSDSDVAKKIAGRHGLRPKVDASQPKHEVLLQQNMTDWEFLQHRARLAGFEVAVDGKQLLFKRQGTVAGGRTMTVRMGESLQQFRVRATAAAQTKRVDVRSYDPDTKREVAGAATRSKAESKLGGTLTDAGLQKTFGKGDTRVDVPYRGAQARTQAKKLAESEADRAAGARVEAEGVVLGLPALVPGMTVKVDDVGKNFSGRYQLTSVRHVIDADGYVTEFTVSGLHDRTLLGLTSGHDGGESARRRGMPVLGVVSNIKDPDKLGRVKVKYPWLGKTVESGFARVVSPGAGAGRGLLVTPELNDQVLVVFEHGDVDHPLVLGGVWGKKDKVPLAMSGDKTPTRMFASRLGHTLMFEDGPKKKSILLETEKKTRVLISDGPKKLVEISDKDGQNKIVVDLQSRKVEITSGGDIELSAKRNVSIAAGGQLDLSGKAGVKVASNARLDLSGSTGAKLGGGTQLDLEGLVANLKGSTMATVKAALVQIN